MGRVTLPPPVKLIAGMISHGEKKFQEARDRMESEYGRIDFASPTLPFDYTDYYDEEMGGGLKKKFVSFEKLIRSEDIAGVKILTNCWEEELMNPSEAKRQINLDPGYITQAKLVLATTKDYSHRIHLGRGIYAEITLSYYKGDYRPHDWTYPDYCSDAYLEIFKHIRGIYQRQIKQIAD